MKKKVLKLAGCEQLSLPLSPAQGPITKPSRKGTVIIDVSNFLEEQRKKEFYKTVDYVVRHLKV
jgi:hypothetical protein